MRKTISLLAMLLLFVGTATAYVQPDTYHYVTHGLNTEITATQPAYFTDGILAPSGVFYKFTPLPMQRYVYGDRTWVTDYTGTMTSLGYGILEQVPDVAPNVVTGEPVKIELGIIKSQYVDMNPTQHFIDVKNNNINQREVDYYHTPSDTITYGTAGWTGDGYSTKSKIQMPADGTN